MNKELPLLAVKSNTSIFAIWLVTISGLIGIWLGHGDWFLPKTPFNLLLGMALLYWNFPIKRVWPDLLIWSLVYIVGMSVEMIGVNTGLLFGNYWYGENLGPKVMNVPLLIGVNWVVLTFLTANIAKRILRNSWLASILGAVLMVFLDFFIEPIAPIFDYWHWQSGIVPLRNFIDWFVISFLLQLLVRKYVPEEKHPFPLHHFASQFLLFVFFYAIRQ